jgi:hypothetical protein
LFGRRNVNFARHLGERNEAIDARADEVHEEGHQFQRFAEGCVAGRDARCHLVAQFARFALGNLDDPARRPVVFRPRLRFAIVRFVERDVFQVQLETREPLVEQLLNAFIGRVHEWAPRSRGLEAKPKPTSRF